MEELISNNSVGAGEKIEKNYNLSVIGDTIAAIGRLGNILNNIINSEQIQNIIKVVSATLHSGLPLLTGLPERYCGSCGHWMICRCCCT